jgi:DNA-binding PadR family transcriptional regulator
MSWETRRNIMGARNWGFDPDDFLFMKRGRRGRKRRQFFESGDMKYVILKLLAARPMHGYEVMKELEEQTRGCYKPSPGSVYPTLQWLEDEGLVKSDERDGKKVYEITEAGVAFLEENKSTVEDIFDRVEELLDHLVGEPMPEINRLVGKLVARVYRLSWKLRREDERRKQITDVLESAINEIESLSD